jgi:hypothetical protein
MGGFSLDMNGSAHCDSGILIASALLVGEQIFLERVVESGWRGRLQLHSKELAVLRGNCHREPVGDVFLLLSLWSVGDFLPCSSGSRVFSVRPPISWLLRWADSEAKASHRTNMWAVCQSPSREVSSAGFIKRRPSIQLSDRASFFGCVIRDIVPAQKTFPLQLQLLATEVSNNPPFHRRPQSRQHSYTSSVTIRALPEGSRTLGRRRRLQDVDVVRGPRHHQQ